VAGDTQLPVAGVQEASFHISPRVFLCLENTSR
jgi:hypothetical protein